MRNFDYWKDTKVNIQKNGNYSPVDQKNYLDWVPVSLPSAFDYPAALP